MNSSLLFSFVVFSSLVKSSREDGELQLLTMMVKKNKRSMKSEKEYEDDEYKKEALDLDLDFDFDLDMF